MKMPFTRACAILLIAAWAFATDAHTALERSNPGSGSVLTQSPPTLTLTFLEAARLTSLTVVNTAGERALAFTPTGSARQFTSARPALRLGRNEIRWRALSADGHVVEGSIIIVLRRPSPPDA